VTLVVVAVAVATGAGGEEALVPEAWVTAACDRCADERAEKMAAIENLRATLADSALSETELTLPDQELRLLDQSWTKEREAAFERLDFLLAGAKAQGIARRVRALRAAADLDEPRRGHYVDPFADALDLLLTTASPCELSAFEGTLLLEAYGQPLAAGLITAGLDLPRALAHIHDVQEHAIENLMSVEAAFATLRPADADSAFQATRALLRRLAPIRATYSPRPRTPEIAAEEGALIAALTAAIQTNAEVPRIHSYLHDRVDELEGTLRTNVPEPAVRRLFEDTEAALYPDAQALAELARVSPAEIADQLAEDLDRWTSEEALPAVIDQLADDPLRTFWYFVQTGAILKSPSLYRGSAVPIPPGTPAISEVHAGSFQTALAQLAALRVPDHYVTAFDRLELALESITATPEAALAHAIRPEHHARDLELLREYFGANATVSTLDVYRWAIRDANRIDGSVAWDVIGAALAGLADLKRAALPALVSAEARSDPEVTSYLMTAGGLLLEIEARQATDRRFQEGTGGAFVGFLLRHFALSDGVPAALWAPGGVTGDEFADLIDGLALENDQSDRRYTVKQATDLQFVKDGVEYHAALCAVIDSARAFLNLTGFDWKHDPGGQEIAYRLMAKKLGIDGEHFGHFRQRFSGIPLSADQPDTLRFYDVPPGKMKNLLIYEHFMSTDEPAVAEARAALTAALGGDPLCERVEDCGDLSMLEQLAGQRFDPTRNDAPYAAAWRAFQAIEGLFAETPPSLDRTRPQSSLAAYFADRDAVHRYVRRHGLKRADRPAEPFPIHAVTDGKQAVSNTKWWVPSSQFPFFFHDPFRSLFHPMQEFDVELIFWKGFLEFPWHLGPVPIPGRMIAGVIPMPFIPYPWLNNVPGLTWAGPGMSLFLQYLLAADPRVWWGMAFHSKSVSNEGMALESGMGIASKYFNAHPDLKTWHDTGIVVRGPIVDDVNDHFVQVFNEARVNNSGGPESRGLEIEKLAYADFVAPAAPPPSSPATRVDPAERSWVLTTYPEDNDYSYRGIFMAALAAARKNIYIENAFFSDPLVAHMLVRKAREFRARVSCEGLDPAACAELRAEGVQIYLIVPDSSDKPIIDAVGTADFHEMLHLGVKIYRWNPQQGWSARKSLHSKAWLVDYEPGQPALAYVGSANATQRSHVADNEVGILTTSPALADALYERVFSPDMLEDARRESPEHFHVVQARPAVRASKSLQKLLVNLFWFF
jgi:hypothetical protein